MVTMGGLQTRTTMDNVSTQQPQKLSLYIANPLSQWDLIRLCLSLFIWHYVWDEAILKPMYNQLMKIWPSSKNGQKKTLRGPKNPEASQLAFVEWLTGSIF